MVYWNIFIYQDEWFNKEERVDDRKINTDLIHTIPTITITDTTKNSNNENSYLLPMEGACGNEPAYRTVRNNGYRINKETTVY